MDADSGCTNPFSQSISQHITLPEPYLSKPASKLKRNKLGLIENDYYMTCDVCKVLKISPDTFRARIYRGFYPEPDKIGDKRIFTYDQIIDLVDITKKLIKEGRIRAGKL